MTEDEVKQIITDEAKLWFDMFSDFKGIERISEEYTVTFFGKSSTAGWAKYDSREVSFNLPLAMLNLQRFIDDTIPHEVAHMIAHRYFKYMDGSRIGKKRSSHHGKSWKYVMEVIFQKDAVRCHNMDTSTVSRREYSYICPRCHKIHHVGKNLHTKMQAGSNRWCRCISRMLMKADTSKKFTLVFVP